MPVALEPAIDARLRHIALDRVRVGAILVLVALIASLVMTEPVGVPIPAYLYGVNLTCCVGLGVILFLSLKGRIPLRFAHTALAVVGIAPGLNTLLVEAVTGNPSLAIPMMLGIVSFSLQFDTRWCVALVVGLFGTWVPVHVSLGHPDTAMVVACAFACCVMAISFQVYARRAIVNAERSRASAENLRDQFIHAQRMDAVGTLAAGLAHDMNNILAGILGLGELMRESATDPAQQEDLASICREAQRGASLTHALVAFSRKGQYRRDQVELDGIIDQMVPLLRRTLPKSVRIERIGSSRVVIDGDAAQLGQVLVNLSVNAADATDGPGQLTIATNAITVDAAHAERLHLAPGRYGTIEVTDTGAGMDEATRARIFEPFFTTKPQGKGTGLGLAMAYGVAQAHAGAIEVESTLGTGSTFRLYIPVVSEVAAPKPVKKISDRFRKVMRVLVVDDEPLVRDMAKRMLGRFGLEVLLAENGAVAVDLMKERGNDVSLVLLDMSMPVMGGAECFKRLREMTKVPVLLASGYAVEAEAQELLATGAAGFLDKPYTAATLGEHLQRILGPLERVPARARA
jgi:signal transduction histidine kinase/CheY-like chemotaxis protein